MIRPFFHLVCALIFTAFSADGAAAEDQSIINGPPTKRLWAFNLAMEQIKLHGDRGNDIVGKAASVGFGLGYFINDRWLVQGFVGLRAGPWDRVRDSSFNSDFSGTGVSLETIYGLTGSSLRSGGSMWSFALVTGYTDLAGKSIGPNRKEPTNPNDSSGFFLEKSYQINANILWLNPGIEWTYIKAPRSTGNTPELLATRIEGCSIRVSAGVPIFASYRARSVARINDQGASQAQQEVTDKGRLRGYSVITSLQTWLGS